MQLGHRQSYGDRSHTAGVTGAKAEGGTNWLWPYATAVSLLPGHRHTLAATTVGPDEALTAVVRRPLIQVTWSGTAVGYVLPDRAFYAVGVLDAPKARNLRFIVPMVRRGGDSRRFFRRGCRGWFEHTARGHRPSDGSAPAPVAVVPGSDGNRPQVFARSAGFAAPAVVALVCGRRFGIESSYRQLGECLAVTTSRDVVYRLLSVGVSLLIRAWWVLAEGTTLNPWRWELILMFTTAQPDTDATQTDTPQPHATT